MTEPIHAKPDIPRVGMLATIRNRRGLIASVAPFDTQPEGRLHLVHVEYTDSDGVPEDTVIWEREHGRDLLEPHALPRPGGRFGFLVPSGVYTDKGSTDLRTLLLERCRWEWLFGFENREKVFDIDSRFKFCPLIVRKDGHRQSIRAAFMHRALEDWEEAERHVMAYPGEQVARFSPRSKSILEIRSERDLEVLEKLYAGGVLLGDGGRPVMPGLSPLFYNALDICIRIRYLSVLYNPIPSGARTRKLRYGPFPQIKKTRPRSP